ncbi:MAG TPA: diheme cytochrome c-553, partial [Casimicrobiaceae bacterium]|nr:diheme cytochrome c-553 [Casimicrobiaceae bacterium]
PDLTAWAGPWGVSYAANLTPDKTGIAGWTVDQFIQAMRTGKHLGVGRPILPPMPWQQIGKLTDRDLRAIYAYLKSLKPIDNQVPAPTPPK